MAPDLNKPTINSHIIAIPLRDGGIRKIQLEFEDNEEDRRSSESQPRDSKYSCYTGW